MFVLFYIIIGMSKAERQLARTDRTANTTRNEFWFALYELIILRYCVHRICLLPLRVVRAMRPVRTSGRSAEYSNAIPIPNPPG